MCICKSRKVLKFKKLGSGFGWCDKPLGWLLQSVQHFYQKPVGYEQQNQKCISDSPKTQKHTSLTSKLSIAYSKYNYVRYVQSAASWQPVVLQSSCPVMPVLTEHGLEIAGLVLRGWKKPQLERLPCAQRCDHNIIKWKKKQEIMGRAKEKRDPPLVMNESVSEESRAWRDTTIACFWTVCGSCSHVIALLRVQPPFGG